PCLLLLCPGSGIRDSSGCLARPPKGARAMTAATPAATPAQTPVPTPAGQPMPPDDHAGTQEAVIDSPLYHYVRHGHKPRNVNDVHEQEKANAGFNQKVAMGLTKVFQSMTTFWLIAAWIFLWIVVNTLTVAFDPLPWLLLLP